jgi:hypothetical protein
MTPELVSITETHLQQYLQDALGLDILAVDLTSFATEYTSTYILEEMDNGRVYFPQGSVVPTTSTLDLLVRNAFVGLALDEYISTLQNTALSPILKSAIYAELVVDGATPPNGAQQQQGNSDGGFEWTTPWIIIVAGGGAAVLAVCCLAFLLFSAKCQRRDTRGDVLAKVASNDTPLSFNDDGMELFRNEGDDDASGSYCSDGTSVYSYKQHDDSSVSLAPSFLHAINERSALGAFYDTDDDSLKAPSVLWQEQAAAQSEQRSPAVSSRRPDSVVISPKNGDEYNSFHAGLRRENELDNDSVDDQSWMKDEGPSMIENDQSSWIGGASQVDDEDDDQQASLYMDTDDDDSLLRKMTSINTEENQSKSQATAPQPAAGGADFSNLWEGEEKKDDLPVDVSFEENGDASFHEAASVGSKFV